MTSKYLKGWLASINPDEKGNKVEDILKEYVTLADLDKPVNEHVEYLENSLFGAMEGVAGENPEFKKAKEKFGLYAKAYITSAQVRKVANKTMKKRPGILELRDEDFYRHRSGM